ncbi:MAG TPA: PKD domain-containing protein [Brumimicrobium sp.]|nr:PKD domain-containing protein [Brumimicrobium sp.]
MRLFKLLFILFLPAQLFASHIVGGEMYYDCLGDNNYRIVIKIYRDCNSDGAAYDRPIYLGIFDKSNNTRVRMEPVNYPGSDVLPVVFSSPCITAPSNICVQEAIYSKVINLPPLPEGYIIAYERCCRGPEIMNLFNPGSLGLTMTTTIPGTNSGVSCNSSPRFNNYPPLLLCNNEPLYFDHSATDPDGDDLVYELSTPFHGGSNLDPMPNPTTNPPFSLINWGNGFGPTQPFGVTGPITIDPNTGQLTASPDLIGKFVVGVTVKEYRNGVLIGSTQRDFLFTVFNCVIDVNAKIVKQEDLNSFSSYCDGLTIYFENESYGGDTYEWNFGVPNDPNNTSTMLHPTFTFPNEGDYTVRLIINPGWACADTSYEEFSVYEGLNVSFEPPDPQCISNNSFDFQGLGDYKNGATFEWEFGANATPSSATTENVNGVVYNSAGAYEVTYTANWNDCRAEFSDSVRIHREPILEFDFEGGLFCAPETVAFKDNSEADAPMNYLWSFGDGTTSQLKDPYHLYENPGLYDITLKVSTIIGCVSTLTLTKPELITIAPSPIAAFSINPENVTIFDSEVTISDESTDSPQHYYQLTPEMDTTDRNITLNITDGGHHKIYQVVNNAYGCKDSTYRIVFMEPYTTLYVPNAFTPDENHVNEIFQPIVHDVSNYSFEVYNRWGKLIFRTTNTKEGWNGQFKGSPSPDGVYLWKVEYMNHLFINEEHYGNFSLIR